MTLQGLAVHEHDCFLLFRVAGNMKQQMQINCETTHELRPSAKPHTTKIIWGANHISIGVIFIEISSVEAACGQPH